MLCVWFLFFSGGEGGWMMSEDMVVVRFNTLVHGGPGQERHMGGEHEEAKPRLLLEEIPHIEPYSRRQINNPRHDFRMSSSISCPQHRTIVLFAKSSLRSILRLQHFHLVAQIYGHREGLLFLRSLKAPCIQ